jgi:CRISPR/Cas system-associated endoribonuclease Cas2
MPVMRMMTNKFTQNSTMSIDSKSGNEKIIAMIKDQSGSKFIQKKIEEKCPEFLYKLYEQIKGNLIDIINDQYGNYVIQKYVELCDKKIISLMLNQLQNSLLEISLNSYGTRALQKIIEYLSSSFTDDDINIILNFIKGNVFKMIRDINGNHVIQSIIDAIKNKDKLTPLYIEMNENMIEISKIKQGCCVFPKVLNNIREDDLGKLIKNVIDNLEILINDEYGNFIIQRIIKLNRENYNNQIFDFLKNKIVKLSTQKYSSNVIETCILEGCNIRDNVIEKLIEKNNVTNLICDQFGNYIIQKCLPLVKGKQFKSMIDQIKKAVKTLNQSNHGRKIYENLLRNYRDYFQDSMNIVYNKGKQKKNNGK